MKRQKYLTFFLALSALMAYMAYDVGKKQERQRHTLAVEVCQSTNEMRESANRRLALQRAYLLQQMELFAHRAKLDAAHGNRDIARLDLKLIVASRQLYEATEDHPLVKCE